MIVTLKPAVADSELAAVRDRLDSLGCRLTEVRTQRGHYLIAGIRGELDLRVVGALPGVMDVHRVSDAYKLVSRKWKAVPTTINLGDGVEITEGGLALIAGPCSVESREQMQTIITHLQQEGLLIMRGGAFKPRTSPYAFRGIGAEGLKLLHELARAAGIKVVSEVLSVHQVELMYDYVDIYQVGARNSQNFELLLELGKVDKPVLLKRGMSSTLDELLQSAEYVFANGNEALILCERGIRTFEPAYRNTLDLNAIPALKEKSHLPVIVDPSHGVGVRRWVEPLALAGIMAGADGVMYEVAPAPERALSDGQQTLSFPESSELIKKARQTFELRQRF
jgi:3-deoxy-7-phosphoheptulonate synthase